MVPCVSAKTRTPWYWVMSDQFFWDSVKYPTGLVDMVHVGWVQRLVRSAQRMGFPGPEPDLVAHGQTRVVPHARKIFETFAELGIKYVSEPTDSQPGSQRIRPVNEVLKFSKATCVDLCVAFCCAALDAGIYPLILTVTADGGQRRHAIVVVSMERQWAMGCDVFVDEGFSRESMLSGGGDLRDLVVESADDPRGTWLAIDVTQVAEQGGEWNVALSNGAKYIREWDWDVLVDIGGLRSRTPDRELPPGGYIDKVLTPARTPLPIEFTPLQLIQARYAIVPFQDGPEIQQLRTWATRMPEVAAKHEGDGDIAVAVVTGAGGTGKTRIAVQLCDEFSRKGWYTGFLPSTTEITDAELSALVEVATELLVVVDYAEEARRGLVARVVHKLCARQSPTRIVLTARGIDQWWDSFRSRMEQDGINLSRTLIISNLGWAQQEAEPRLFADLYERAVEEFSKRMNSNRPSNGVVPDDLGETALDVVLQAWSVVCRERVDSVAMLSDRSELYESVLEIEFAQWRKVPILAEVSSRHLRRAAATLSLISPASDEEQVDAALSLLPEWSSEHLRRGRFAELLVQALLRTDGEKPICLQPDPVADHLILTVFGNNPELLDAMLSLWNDGVGRGC